MVFKNRWYFTTSQRHISLLLRLFFSLNKLFLTLISLFLQFGQLPGQSVVFKEKSGLAEGTIIKLAISETGIYKLDYTFFENQLKLERLVEQLDRIKGNDGEARRRVELYRNLVRATREALPLLRTLKQSQFAADKAPAKCGEATEQLRGVIRGFLDKRDVKGVTQIPLRARGLAEPFKGGLGKTDQQHALMERALSDAQRFDPSEGRWRDVRDRYRASATAVFEYWKRAREAAHTACDELAKGDQHAEVKAAVENLSRSRSDNQNELDRLRVDHEKWKDAKC